MRYRLVWFRTDRWRRPGVGCWLRTVRQYERASDLNWAGPVAAFQAGPFVGMVFRRGALGEDR